MKQSLILMLMTIFTKIFGLLREVSLSYVYGTSEIADAFLVSFFIPSIIINSITIGIATGFIPTYSKIIAEGPREEGDRFLNKVASLTLLISLGLTILGILFSKNLLRIIAVGLDENTMEMAVYFVQMVMTSLIVNALGGVYTGYLHVNNQFSITVLNKIVMNMLIILFLFLSIGFGYKFLGIGTAIGMSAQYLIFIPYLKDLGHKFKVDFDFKDKSLVELKNIALPFLLIVVLNDLNLIVDKAVASTLHSGSISVLNYSSNIQDFVSGVIIVSIITTKYPEMSRNIADKREDLLDKTFNETLKLTLFLVIPAAFGIIVYCKEIIGLLFLRGAFNYSDLILTSKTLFYYAFGLIGIALTIISQRVFFAKRQTRVPIIVSVVSVVINLVLNISLSKIFGIMGLPISTSITMLICGLVQTFFLLKGGLKIKKDTIVKGLGQGLVNSIIVILLTKNLYNMFPNNVTFLLSIILAVALYIFLGIKTGIISRDQVEEVFRRDI